MSKLQFLCADYKEDLALCYQRPCLIEMMIDASAVLCFLLLRSMLPDVVDDFRLANRNSKGHEAIFYSLYAFFTKFAAGISLGVSTLCLQWDHSFSIYLWLEMMNHDRWCKYCNISYLCRNVLLLVFIGLLDTTQERADSPLQWSIRSSCSSAPPRWPASPQASWSSWCTRSARTSDYETSSPWRSLGEDPDLHKIEVKC